MLDGFVDSWFDFVYGGWNFLFFDRFRLCWGYNDKDCLC